MFRCRSRCPWGGAPGGGFWATPCPRVATLRRPLDVGWGLEHDTWMGIVFFVVLGCMAFVGLFILWGNVILNLTYFCYLETWTNLGNAMLMFPPLINYLDDDLTYVNWCYDTWILWIRLLALFRRPLFMWDKFHVVLRILTVETCGLITEGLLVGCNT